VTRIAFAIYECYTAPRCHLGRRNTIIYQFNHLGILILLPLLLPRKMSITTQALVPREVKFSVKLENIVLDSLRPDEVMVDIHATGVCQTDFACANGTLPAAFPGIFGHEGISPFCSRSSMSTNFQKGGGVILDMGSNIKHVQKQDKVLLSFDFCGLCQECKPDHHAYCRELTQRNFGRSLSTPHGA
jgi:D-arabinose 1-dehydrogenase-like Zn-dependent alcohol dehydrogenase